ncbi:MAG: hypothetical protein F6K30_07460 [Cyanothece sp. SIO2G6]|nr:hypothetical protein [Cyanothece sp. SIO2G6]
MNTQPRSQDSRSPGSRSLGSRSQDSRSQGLQSTDAPIAAYAVELHECLSLVKDAETQGLAVKQYGMLRDRLMSEYPDLVALLDMMWDALLVSQRSAKVWERLCDTEKQLTDRMAESHVQLQQNYLRLVQEQ